MTTPATDVQSGRASGINLGICAYPLSRGKETGRGLERVIEEFCRYLTQKNQPFDFYDRGLITSEVKAVVQSVRFLAQLRKTKNDCYFAV